MTIINATTSTGGMLSGDPWNPQGVGDGTTSITYSTVEQTFTLPGTGTNFKFWLTGSDFSQFIASAFITQGAKSVQVTINGKTSVILPPGQGRWTDFASIADFTLPGDIKCVINYVVAIALPTFSNEPVPNTPVPVSAVNELPEEEPTYNPPDPVYTRLPFRDDFDSGLCSGWTGEGYVEGEVPITASNGNINLTGTAYRLIRCYNSTPITELTYEVMIRVNALTDDTIQYEGEEPVEGTYVVFSLLADIILTNSANIVLAPDTVGRLSHGANAKFEKITVDKSLAGGFITTRLFVDDILKKETVTATEATALSTADAGLHYCDGMLYLMDHSTDDINIDIAYCLIREGLHDYAGSFTEVTKSGDITINTNPSPGETFTVSNSVTTVFTFVDHYPNNATEIQIGATTVVTAQALATAINNISGAEFVATVDGSIISVDAYCESAFTMTTTSTGIEISSITEIVPGLITEIATAADSFTASDGGKAVQENATAADSTDGLIDEITEAASVSTVFDTLNVEMDETIEATVVTDFDGLIEYMGEEI